MSYENKLFDDMPNLDLKQLSDLLSLTTSQAEQIAQQKALIDELVRGLKKLKTWVGKLEDWKGDDPPCETVDAALLKAELIIKAEVL